MLTFLVNLGSTEHPKFAEGVVLRQADTPGFFVVVLADKKTIQLPESHIRLLWVKGN